jgi:hypothetical protein
VFIQGGAGWAAAPAAIKDSPAKAARSILPRIAISPQTSHLQYCGEGKLLKTRMRDRIAGFSLID